MKLSDLADDVLACRSMGHAWYHRDDDNHVFRRGELLRFDRHEECARCGAARRRTIDLAAGLVTRRSTKYPLGYRLVGHPRTTRFDALAASYSKELDR